MTGCVLISVDICCPQRSIDLIENRVNMGQDNEQTLIKDHGTLARRYVAGLLTWQHPVGRRGQRRACSSKFGR